MERRDNSRCLKIQTVVFAYLSSGNVTLPFNQFNTFTLRARCLVKPQDDGSDCPQYDINARGTLDRTINQTTVTLRDVDLCLICSTEGVDSCGSLVISWNDQPRQFYGVSNRPHVGHKRSRWGLQKVAIHSRKNMSI